MSEILEMREPALETKEEFSVASGWRARQEQMTERKEQVANAALR
jgi:hypothetical protein